MDPENYENQLILQEYFKEPVDKNICRICLKTCSDEWNLFADNNNLLQKLLTFTKVQVS